MRHDFTRSVFPLALRPLDSNDIMLLMSWRNKPEIRTRFVFSDVITAEKQRLWFDSYCEKQDDVMFIVDELDEWHGPIGAAALYGIHEGRAEFGRLMIGLEMARGRRFGVLITRMVCHVGFSQMKLREIYLHVFADNLSARKIYETLGFQYQSSEARTDLLYMSLTAEAFGRENANLFLPPLASTGNP